MSETLVALVEPSSEMAWPRVVSYYGAVGPNIVETRSSGLGWLNIELVGVCMENMDFGKIFVPLSMVVNS